MSYRHVKKFGGILTVYDPHQFRHQLPRQLFCLLYLIPPGYSFLRSGVDISTMVETNDDLGFIDPNLPRKNVRVRVMTIYLGKHRSLFLPEFPLTYYELCNHPASPSLQPALPLEVVHQIFKEADKPGSRIEFIRRYTREALSGLEDFLDAGFSDIDEAREFAVPTISDDIDQKYYYAEV